MQDSSMGNISSKVSLSLSRVLVLLMAIEKDAVKLNDSATTTGSNSLDVATPIPPPPKKVVQVKVMTICVYVLKCWINETCQIEESDDSLALINGTNVDNPATTISIKVSIVWPLSTYIGILRYCADAIETTRSTECCCQGGRRSKIGFSSSEARKEKERTR